MTIIITRLVCSMIETQGLEHGRETQFKFFWHF